MQQGQYLKEIGVSFISEDKLNLNDIAIKLKRMIKLIGMNNISQSINILFPGFDILIGLKESCCYFGYWGETQYVRMFVSSCKQFDERKVIKFIKRNFSVKNKIRMTIISDISIKEEVEDLSLERC